MNRSFLLAAFLGAVSLAGAARSAFGADAPAPAGSAAPAAAPAPSSTHAPFAVTGDPVRGQRTFRMFCSDCHGLRAEGFVGPWIGDDVVNPKNPHNAPDNDLRPIVRYGLEPYGGMPRFTPVAVSDKDIEDIRAYLLTVPLNPN
jgi:mono/diheme cytochrome c family protein